MQDAADLAGQDVGRAADAEWNDDLDLPLRIVLPSTLRRGENFEPASKTVASANLKNLISTSQIRPCSGSACLLASANRQVADQV